MLFSYDPKKDYFTFYNYENFADSAIAIPDNIPYGTFILDFLELDIEDLYQTSIELKRHQRRKHKTGTRLWWNTYCAFAKI